MMNRKQVKDSLTEQVYIVRPQHANCYERLFGGMLMQWMDEMAGVVSRRHSGQEIVTAAVDNLNFKEAARIGDMVVLVGKVTHVGHTSMEIRVDVYIEKSSGLRRSINRAYFVMVAVNAKGEPMRVPELEIRTESEKAEWQGGEKRYDLRRLRRVEGY